MSTVQGHSFRQTLQSLLGRRLKLLGKLWLFPGLDLHTRCRYRFLPTLFMSGPVETLDAGCGNGALSLAAYGLGNTVYGVTINEWELESTRPLLAAMRVPADRVQLHLMNIYDLESIGRQFDQIICSETLEHLTRDADVVAMFGRMLRPGGRLILCAPHALHPEHALGRTDEPETGYHVRDGYTIESYRALLESAGLTLTQTMGLGTPLLCFLDRILRAVRLRVGDTGALPLFLAFLPLARLDRPNPPLPFSLAVVGEKRAS